MEAWFHGHVRWKTKDVRGMETEEPSVEEKEAKRAQTGAVGEVDGVS